MTSINNYSVLPEKISVRNAKGQHLKLADSNFKGLHEAIKGIAQYKVVFTTEPKRKLFTTRDGSSVVSAVMSLEGLTGNLVFLPYFNLSDMTTDDEEDDEVVWTEEAIRISKRVTGELIEMDKVLRASDIQTPKPKWMDSMKQPQKITDIDQTIQKYEETIVSLQGLKESELESKKALLEYSALFYENGQLLENAIEKTLKLLDYNAHNFRDDDLEIDHIIVSPEGVRMIGESEGKDNSAIDVSKFRQLESNINEDFNREEVDVPAKGILFGNGYRLTEPSKRGDQFTHKCLVNAKRLGTVLIRTADLYNVALHLIDNPEDEQFKKSCRFAIENTVGDIVEFPLPKVKSKRTPKKVAD